jgi:hypothetical protein
MREAEKVERLGTTLAATRSSFGCKAAELDQPRLGGM